MPVAGFILRKGPSTIIVHTWAARSCHGNPCTDQVYEILYTIYYMPYTIYHTLSVHMILFAYMEPVGPVRNARVAGWCSASLWVRPAVRVRLLKACPPILFSIEHTGFGLEASQICMTVCVYVFMYIMWCNTMYCNARQCQAM